MFQEKKAIELLRKEPKFTEIINQIGDYHIKLTKNRYQSLVEAIITQQLSSSAAKSIIKKFRRLYKSKFPKPIDVLRTPNSKLRLAGLSKMKINYIKELSKNIESKQLNLRKISMQNDDQVIESLTDIKGIGRWTAEMFLIFSLGRLDVLPVSDLGLKKAVQSMYSLKQLPKEAEIEQLAIPWKPYRTIATWYLWKSLEKFDNI
jgi:DNA-3-methyladenine glycosylase II